MEIDRIVPRTSLAVYVLDKTRIGPFNVNYVGRADDDLNRAPKKYATHHTREGLGPFVEVQV